MHHQNHLEEKELPIKVQQVIYKMVSQLMEETQISAFVSLAKWQMVLLKHLREFLLCTISSRQSHSRLILKRCKIVLSHQSRSQVKSINLVPMAKLRAINTR